MEWVLLVNVNSLVVGLPCRQASFRLNVSQNILSASVADESSGRAGARSIGSSVRLKSPINTSIFVISRSLRCIIIDDQKCCWKLCVVGAYMFRMRSFLSFR